MLNRPSLDLDKAIIEQPATFVTFPLGWSYRPGSFIDEAFVYTGPIVPHRLQPTLDYEWQGTTMAVTSVVPLQGVHRLFYAQSKQRGLTMLDRASGLAWHRHPQVRERLVLALRFRGTVALGDKGVAS